MKLLFVAVLLTACAQQTPAPPSDPAPPPVAPSPRVILPDNFAYSVEVSADPDLREQGLMYRDQLRPAAGMLFLFPTDGNNTFWMKNTMIPLDIIWIDAERRVVHIETDVPPCRIEQCPSYGPRVPSRYVLELAAGEAAKHRLTVGDVLRFEGMDDVVVR